MSKCPKSGVLELLSGAVAQGLILLLSPMLAAQTIYFDDFNRNGASSLNGSAPTTDNSGGASVWTSGQNILNNGVATFASGNGEFTATLPFTPEIGYQYTLAADIQMLNVVNSWIGLGFVATAGTHEERWIDTGQGWDVSYWALSRGTNATNVDAGFARGTQQPSVQSTTSSADQVQIVLRTLTAETWAVTWNWGNGQYIETRTYTNASSPPIPGITRVGFSASGDVSGSAIDNFLLTGASITPTGNQWQVNGGGLWNAGGNWSGGVPASGADVVFGSVLATPNAPAAVNLNVNANVSRVTFADEDMCVLGGTGTLTLRMQYHFCLSARPRARHA